MTCKVSVREYCNGMYRTLNSNYYTVLAKILHGTFATVIVFESDSYHMHGIEWNNLKKHLLER